MARIVYSALVQSINGTIAGTTFQRNAYGHTIKKKPNIVNPNRLAQQPRKQAVQYVSQQWAAMTAAQRTAWNNQAVTYPVPSRLNPNANLSGHALWLRANLLLQLIGGGVITNITVPAQSVITPGDPIIQRVGATLTYFDDTASSLANVYAMGYLSGIVKLTQTYDRSRARFCGFFNIAGTDHVDVTTAYTQLFGVLPVIGQSVFLKRIYFNAVNGQVVEYKAQNFVVA